MGRPRTYMLNDDYFEKIDNPNKAYILGFIYADGTVSKKNILQITISLKDVEIIDFIIKEIEFTGKYRIITRKQNQYVRLTINSKKIVSDLNSLGVIINKTYESKTLPITPQKYYQDMIRGIFDGDGSIYSNKRNNRSREFTISFSSNENVLNEIKNYFEENHISCCKIRFRHKDSVYSGILEIRGAMNIEKIHNLLYKCNSFYLKRKYDRFIDFFDVISKMDKRKQPKEQIDKIKDLYLSGYKQKEIHLILNIPFPTVRGTIQRLRKSHNIV